MCAVTWLRELWLESAGPPIALRGNPAKQARSTVTKPSDWNKDEDAKSTLSAASASADELAVVLAKKDENEKYGSTSCNEQADGKNSDTELFREAQLQESMAEHRTVNPKNRNKRIDASTKKHDDIARRRNGRRWFDKEE